MKLRHLTRWLFCAALAGCACEPQHAQYVARLEALALLQTLNADLLSHPSATQTLERWCADHKLADPPRIVAQRVRDAAKPIPEELRAQLAIDADEPVAYRHVRLMCGEHVFSEADNWYVPARLTPQMNRELDETDTPFGKVVAPLRFQRRTLSAQLLWSPLPAGWEMSATRDVAPATIPHDVLRHTAVLSVPERGPISVVVETYTGAVFDLAR